MTKKEKRAMIERKKAEAEQAKTVSDKMEKEKDEKVEKLPEDSVSEYNDDDEIIEILSNIDFNIDYCIDQDTITDKVIYLANAEKNILKEFKDNNMILSNGIYRDLYNTIIDVFHNYIDTLKNRLALIIKSEKQQAAMDRLQFIVGDLKQNKIDNKFAIKMLKYKNWLYFWQKWREHGIERKQAKAEHKAKIKALKAQAAEAAKNANKGVVMSP